MSDGGCDGGLGILREVLLAIGLGDRGTGESEKRSVWCALANVGDCWGLRSGA